MGPKSCGRQEKRLAPKAPKGSSQFERNTASAYCWNHLVACCAHHQRYFSAGYRIVQLPPRRTGRFINEWPKDFPSLLLGGNRSRIDTALAQRTVHDLVLDRCSAAFWLPVHHPIADLCLLEVKEALFSVSDQLLLSGLERRIWARCGQHRGAVAELSKPTLASCILMMSAPSAMGHNRPRADIQQYGKTCAMSIQDAFLPALLAFLAVGVSVHAQSPTSSKTIKCTAHSHALTVESFGHEHVKHRLFLDSKFEIKELNEHALFVESVTCSSTGFDIFASHRQYGDPSARQFRVTLARDGSYKLTYSAIGERTPQATTGTRDRKPLLP